MDRQCIYTMLLFVARARPPVGFLGIASFSLCASSCLQAPRLPDTGPCGLASKPASPRHRRLEAVEAADRVSTILRLQGDRSKKVLLVRPGHQNQHLARHQLPEITLGALGPMLEPEHFIHI